MGPPRPQKRTRTVLFQGCTTPASCSNMPAMARLSEGRVKIKGEILMKLKVIAIDHHRNGICGAPFDVVLFEEAGNKVGILFNEPNHCAVLDTDLLAKGDIAFRSNSGGATTMSRICGRPFVRSPRSDKQRRLLMKGNLQRRRMPARVAEAMSLIIDRFWQEQIQHYLACDEAGQRDHILNELIVRQFLAGRKIKGKERAGEMNSKLGPSEAETAFRWENDETLYVVKGHLPRNRLFAVVPDGGKSGQQDSPNRRRGRRV